MTCKEWICPQCNTVMRYYIVSPLHCTVCLFKRQKNITDIIENYPITKKEMKELINDKM
jgi:hypothetical protein